MFIKTLGTSFIGSSSVSQLSNYFFKRKPLVVLYHGVTKENDFHGIENYRGKHVSAEAFEKQISWLSKYFTIVPLKEIERLIGQNKKLNKPLCAITFDDGYRNNFLNAYPILKKYNVPATIFLTTGFIEKKIALWPDILEHAISHLKAQELTLHFPEGEQTYTTRTRKDKLTADMDIRNRLKKVSSDKRESVLGEIQNIAQTDLKQVLSYSDYAPLSWNEIREMKENGLITFGAHTDTHPILSQESEEFQREEIRLSVDMLRSTIGDCEHFAYPNGQGGDWNGTTKRILRELHILYAWTTEGRRVNMADDNRLELPRVTLDATENFNRFRALASLLPTVRSLIHHG